MVSFQMFAASPRAETKYNVRPSRPQVDCFHVNNEEFDGIFERIRSAGIKYRSTPTGADDLHLNTRMGGRNFYWNDDDGHVWEVLTVSYARRGA